MAPEIKEKKISVHVYHKSLECFIRIIKTVVVYPKESDFRDKNSRNVIVFFNIDVNWAVPLGLHAVRDLVNR